MIELTVLNQTDYQKMLKEKPLVVSYAYGTTSFGRCLIGFIGNKLCHFSFLKDDNENRFETLRKEWPGASFVNDEAAAQPLIVKVFEEDVNMHVICRGTSFQEKVWRALLKIKKGETCHYGDVAVAIGQPSATRAVANAIARNPISYLVPCHRVISKNGDIYKYGGGCATKKKLLSFEGFHE